MPSALNMPVTDPRFAAFADSDFADEPNGGPSGLSSHDDDESDNEEDQAESDVGDRSGEDEDAGMRRILSAGSDVGEPICFNRSILLRDG